MIPVLDRMLCERFPTLYAQRGKDMVHTAMCWGFECGDGWFPLIWELSEKLAESFPDVQATQVKEKFGTLRFYVNDYQDGVEELIDAAEALSEKTCERCGDPGTLCGTSWLRTLCKHCEGRK